MLNPTKEGHTENLKLGRKVKNTTICLFFFCAKDKEAGFIDIVM